MRRPRLTAAISFLAATAAIALASPAASGAVASAASHPRIGAKVPDGAASTAGWASTNWSGYAIQTGSGRPSAYTSISGTWTVPSVSRSQKLTLSSSWLGIDGFNNNNLIQTGTESDWYNGSAHYYAWWEILPAAETQITSMTVHPGDTITASIAQQSDGTWNITIADKSSTSFTTKQNYNGSLSSAEWIEEATSLGGHVATLAHYSTFAFDDALANGANPQLTTADAGVMVQHGVQVSTPSSPDVNTDGFAMAYGSTAPPVPAS